MSVQDVYPPLGERIRRVNGAHVMHLEPAFDPDLPRQLCPPDCSNDHQAVSSGALRCSKPANPSSHPATLRAAHSAASRHAVERVHDRAACSTPSIWGDLRPLHVAASAIHCSTTTETISYLRDGEPARSPEYASPADPHLTVPPPLSYLYAGYGSTRTDMDNGMDCSAAPLFAWQPKRTYEVSYSGPNQDAHVWTNVHRGRQDTVPGGTGWLLSARRPYQIILLSDAIARTRVHGLLAGLSPS
ncbi:hypothetical protein B0H13DRAFT_2322200 [Mycena leptocephala]|nr:hypothetical protein B0H13DRAFT_2322200 [Mycena leptocephala]